MGMSASQARMLSLTARLSDLEYQAQSVSNSKIRLADQSEEAAQSYQDALDKEKLTVYNGDTASYVDANAYLLTTYSAVSETDKQRFIKDTSGRVLVTSAMAKAYDNANGSLETFLNYLGYTTNTAVTSATSTSITGTDGTITTKDIIYDGGAVSYYTNVFNEVKESGGYNSPGDDKMRDSEWLERQIEMGNIFLFVYDFNGGTKGTGDYVNVSWTSGDASLQTTSDKTDLAKSEAEYETTMASIQSKDKRLDLQLTEINTEHSAIQTEIDAVKKVIDKNIERSFKTFSA